MFGIFSRKNQQKKEEVEAVVRPNFVYLSQSNEEVCMSESVSRITSIVNLDTPIVLQKLDMRFQWERDIDDAAALVRLAQSKLEAAWINGAPDELFHGLRSVHKSLECSAQTLNFEMPDETLPLPLRDRS